MILGERDHLIPYLIRSGGPTSCGPLSREWPDVVLELEIVHISGHYLYGHIGDRCQERLRKKSLQSSGTLFSSVHDGTSLTRSLPNQDTPLAGAPRPLTA